LARRRKRIQTRDTRFHQQRLPAWKPVLTSFPIIVLYFLIGLVFILSGVGLFIGSQNVVETQLYRYDLKCAKLLNTTKSNNTCRIVINVPQLMNSPVYFYYRLGNFYQNYRGYTKSVSYSQLAGKDYQYSELSSCSPKISLDNLQIQSDVYLPCGLIAGSYFNDTFTLLSVADEQPIPWSSDGIAWETDLGLSQNPPPDEAGIKTVPEIKSEEFSVWLRLAAFHNFRKLHRIINQNLESGNYYLDINDTFPVDGFGGTKSVILSTANWLGGKNNFLAGGYILTGAVSLVFAIAFTLERVLCPKRPPLSPD